MNETQAPPELPSLDDLDLGIVKILRADPRSTNRVIAGKLGTPESTIGARIRRLEQAGAMRIIAELDMAAFGYQIFALLAVQILPDQLEQAAMQFAAMEEISGVVEMMGTPQLYVTVLARDLDDLSDLLEQRIKSVNGVCQITTTLSMRHVLMTTDYGILANHD